MVEPPRPDPAGRRLERVAVVERAGAEHRRERHDVDPGGEPRQRPVGEHDEHDPGHEGDEERPQVEHAAQTRLLERMHRKDCA